MRMAKGKGTTIDSRYEQLTEDLHDLAGVAGRREEVILREGQILLWTEK
jgi:hypothetical protein